MQDDGCENLAALGGLAAYGTRVGHGRLYKRE
jgi:hypothetical protein